MVPVPGRGGCPIVIRIAFPIIGGRGWTGGYNYLLNLLQVLQTQAADRVTPVVLFGPDSSPEDRAPFAALAGVEIVVDPAMEAGGKARRLIEALVTGLDSAAAKTFRAHRIDMVFEAAQYYGWRVPVPAVAWIPDFQHRYLPHLFSRSARLRRALGFNAQVWSGRRVMLSSEDARKDCERFHPASRGRTSVVRFAIPREAPVDAEAARSAAARHGLPDHFFFMPNQFWTHKNHAVVIEALARLRTEGRDIVVAASGNPVDPRDPAHFERLRARAAELGVSDLFRPLGLIPYGDIALLMRASSALINPSLFEGWSTTVEEAKATGTPMILSDLGVHREQAPDRALFFDPGAPAELADRLRAFEPWPEAVRKEAAERAVVQSRIDAKAFAEAFLAMTDSVTHAPNR